MRDVPVFVRYAPRFVKDIYMVRLAKRVFLDGDNPQDAPVFAHSLLRCVDRGVPFERILGTLERSAPEVALNEHFAHMRAVASVYRPSLIPEIDAFEKEVCSDRGITLP